MSFSSYNALIDSLIRDGYLKTPRIIDAFKATDRAGFVLQALISRAYENIPLPIGYKQTISQPLTVAFMLELLQPEAGNKILEIGAGSGWQTALLAYCVGDKGKVLALERIPEISAYGERNVSNYGFISSGRVQWKCEDGSSGFLSEAPYDRIIAAASASEFPESWLKQLTAGGRLVVPVKNSIWLAVRGEKEGEFRKTEYPGFAFVPLIHNQNT